MKYYSEILNKTFDTVDALEEAEKAEKTRLVEKAKAEDDKKKKLEEVTKAMEEAYQDYSVARAACDDAYSKYIGARRKYLNVVHGTNVKTNTNINSDTLSTSIFPSLDELFNKFFY